MAYELCACAPQFSPQEGCLRGVQGASTMGTLYAVYRARNTSSAENGANAAAAAACTSNSLVRVTKEVTAVCRRPQHAP